MPSKQPTFPGFVEAPAISGPEKPKKQYRAQCISCNEYKDASEMLESWCADCFHGTYSKYDKD